MRKWGTRLMVLAVVAVLGFFAWRLFFPNAEDLIKKRLLELAKIASIAPNESPVAKLANAGKLADFFASEVEIRIDVPGYAHQAVTSRQDVFQLAQAARMRVTFLQVQFLDISVQLDPGGGSAIAHLTARASSAERENWVEEMAFTFKKIGRDWLIIKVETVKTLSNGKPFTLKTRGDRTSQTMPDWTQEACAVGITTGPLSTQPHSHRNEA